MTIMSGYIECDIKVICCTCLCTHRKLLQLCRIYNGVNILYLLLSMDTEAYRECFYKTTADLFVCWECAAILKRLSDFRLQACVAQKKLLNITDGKIKIHKESPLTKLKICKQKNSEINIFPTNISEDNFIDCGAPDEIKSEIDIDDPSISQLNPVAYPNLKQELKKLKISHIISKRDNEDEIKNEFDIDNEGDIDNTGNKHNIDTTSDNINLVSYDVARPQYNYRRNEYNVKNNLFIRNIKTLKVKKILVKDNFGINSVKRRKTKLDEIGDKNSVGDIDTTGDKDEECNIDATSEILKDKIPVYTVKEDSVTYKERNIGLKSIDNSFYKILIMTEKQMMKNREKIKLQADLCDAIEKCNMCVEGFRSNVDLENHNNLLHKQKDNHEQCNICGIYVQKHTLSSHIRNHYLKCECQMCGHITYTESDILRHLESSHNVLWDSVGKKEESNTPHVNDPGLKPPRNKPMMDKPTPLGYKCPECDKYFQNKNTRYKHLRISHREGYTCDVCGKRYPFKNVLTKHIRLHQAPVPRVECEVCHKLIRVDFMKNHVLVHSDRESFSCVECDKTFVSRASYEHHLKYSKAHAIKDVLRYKCSTCNKGYKTRAELRDHINYQHLGKTHHKCPVCGKALATPRCITRHVKRMHEEIKENAKDKICQQCGKAFRDWKCLRQHEYIHTGERPLSCEICGCTFRQKASLYTHKKRVHKIHSPKKSIVIVEPAIP